MRDVMIAGIGTVKFGSFPNVGNYVAPTNATLAALRDAGIEWKDVQMAFCGSVYQGTGSGHQALRELGLSGIPIVNVENACSSGTSAFRQAYQAIAYGMADIAIALGFEKLPKGAIPSTAFRPWQLAQGFNVQPANYALETMDYMHKYGVDIDQISAITIKNRKHATLNPYARFQKEVTLEEINASRMIASPLRLFHCAPTADGATCIVLMAKDKLKDPARAVRIRAVTMISGQYGDAFYQNGMVQSVLIEQIRTAITGHSKFRENNNIYVLRIRLFHICADVVRVFGNISDLNRVANLFHPCTNDTAFHCNARLGHDYCICQW